MPDARPPTPADCERTRELLSHFLHRGLTREEDRGFRSHLTACEACRRLYRETMASAAPLGRAMREARDAHEKERRHEELREMALASGRRPRRRRFGLRLMLLPVAFILLLTQWHRLVEEPGRLTLTWSGGEVRAAGQLLSPDRPELELADGDWCQTRGNARARIVGKDCSFDLEVGTQLLVEKPSAGRVRLQQGELIAAGDCVVSSPFGVLELEGGTALVRVSGGKIEVECRSGGARWTDPTGSRSLAAGQRL